VSSSHNLTSAIVGSTLWVDDLSFSGYNKVKDIPKPGATVVSVYPNPANYLVNFKFNTNQIAHLTIYDILGTRVKSLEVKSNSMIVSTEGLNDGLYFYQVADKEEQVIATGRFSIKR
jgi:hypothetical protein